MHAYSFIFISMDTARHPSVVHLKHNVFACGTLETQCICIGVTQGRVTVLKSIYSKLQRVKSSIYIP